MPHDSVMPTSFHIVINVFWEVIPRCRIDEYRVNACVVLQDVIQFPSMSIVPFAFPLVCMSVPVFPQRYLMSMMSGLIIVSLIGEECFSVKFLCVFLLRPRLTMFRVT